MEYDAEIRRVRRWLPWLAPDGLAGDRETVTPSHSSANDTWPPHVECFLPAIQALPGCTGVGKASAQGRREASAIVTGLPSVTFRQSAAGRPQPERVGRRNEQTTSAGQARDGHTVHHRSPAPRIKGRSCAKNIYGIMRSSAGRTRSPQRSWIRSLSRRIQATRRFATGWPEESKPAPRGALRRF